MQKINYTSKFYKAFKKLPKNIESLAVQKIDLFQNNPYTQSLKTHSLSGVLEGLYSFSINYSYRILFKFETKNEVTFLNNGTHSIYQ